MPRQYFYERINWQETSPCARLQITWNRISRAKEYLLHCKSMLIWAADWWDWCASWDKDETFSLWHPPTPPLCTHACNNSWQQNINKVSCQQQLQQHRQWQRQWWKDAKILTQECSCALLVLWRTFAPLNHTFMLLDHTSHIRTQIQLNHKKSKGFSLNKFCHLNPKYKDNDNENDN